METIYLDIQNAEAPLGGLSSVAQQARKDLGILDNQLLSLRLNFGKLRASIERAFAPITATVAPVLNSAVRALTDFCDDAGAVMAALFGTVYKKAVTTTKATGSAIRRTLASFDQIERLNGGGGGGGSTTSVKLEPINDPLTPQLQAIVDTIRAVMDKIKSLIAPLKAIDFTPAAEAFRRLGSVIGSFGLSALQSLEKLWFNLLTPLAAWTIETAVPASVNVLTAAFQTLGAVFAPVKAGLEQLLKALTPAGQFLLQTVGMALNTLEDQFAKLTLVFSDRAPVIIAAFGNIALALRTLWEKAQPLLTNLRQLWLNIMDIMGTAAAKFALSVIDIFCSLTEFIAGVATGNWSRAWNGLKGILKGAVNGIIGLINSLLSGMAAGLNAITRALNSWSVTVPSWVPILGGKQFGFNLKPITAPQIPLLAQGAVLPANKPFLAMVGDQRHGTNIEAPLSTIQEAVALVMRDQTDAIMAGFSASVEVQREILSAVLGISIGDDMIANAYDRYRTRQAVMKGAYHAL